MFRFLKLWRMRGYQETYTEQGLLPARFKVSMTSWGYIWGLKDVLGLASEQSD